MTECSHEDCTQEAFATIEWECNVTKAYCQTHIKQASEDIPAYIEGVEQV
jgi:hypothetical protein